MDHVRDTLSGVQSALEQSIPEAEEKVNRYDDASAAANALEEHMDSLSTDVNARLDNIEQFVAESKDEDFQRTAGDAVEDFHHQTKSLFSRAKAFLADMWEKIKTFIEEEAIRWLKSGISFLINELVGLIPVIALAIKGRV